MALLRRKISACVSQYLAVWGAGHRSAKSTVSSRRPQISKCQGGKKKESTSAARQNTKWDSIPTETMTPINEGREKFSISSSPWEEKGGDSMPSSRSMQRLHGKKKAKVRLTEQLVERPSSITPASSQKRGEKMIEGRGGSSMQ